MVTLPNQVCDMYNMKFADIMSIERVCIDELWFGKVNSWSYSSISQPNHVDRATGNGNDFGDTNDNNKAVTMQNQFNITNWQIFEETVYIWINS